ncbi:MAG TPA: EamA family transporter [Pyrinomonadaceae bacterium]|nr:EamA family transporter [Pyrinomonadaceae bacterium]
MATDREKLGAYGAWASVCFFWGTTYLAISVGLETFPPMLFAGLRFLTAGVILFLLMSRQRNVRLPRGREWVSLTGVGLALLAVGNGSVVWAQQYLTSGMAALLVATGPFWVATLEGLRADGERVNRWGVLGLLLGFGGLGILVAPKLFGAELGVGYLAGVLAIQLACFSWSAGSVYAKHNQVGVHPLMGASVQMLAAGVALTLLGTFTGEWGVLRVSPRSLAALAYLVVFGSIVAYGSYIYAMQKLPLSIVSTYTYINPVIAVLLGWAVLGEGLDWRMALGASVILGGVALVKAAPKLSSRRRARLDEQEKSHLERLRHGNSQNLAAR